MEKECRSAGSTLMEAEAASDGYLKQLERKIFELEQKLDEEKVLSGQLQEIMCQMQGRIAVHHQRTGHLRIEEFQRMMTKAREELENAKNESDDLSRETICAGTRMLESIEQNTSRFETIRIQFKSNETIASCCELESTQIGNVKKNLGDVESKLAELETSNDNVKRTLSELQHSDILKNSLLDVLNAVSAEICELSNMKLKF